MMKRRSIQLLRIARAGSVALALAAMSSAAADSKRVLILDPFGLDIPPYSACAASFREALARELGGQAEFFEVSLDVARFGEPEGKGPILNFLQSRLEARPVDLVVPIGTEATDFAARHRERLFPETPVLVLATAARRVPPGLEENTALAVHRVNLPGMVEDILQIRPETTEIVVLIGDSVLERYWMDACRKEFQPFTNRVHFTWLNGLPFDEELRRCAELPPTAFILLSLYVVDASGVPFEHHDAIRRLHAAASAPIYGYFESHLGLGAIGGRLFQDRKIGEQAGVIAARILRGERPEDIPPVILQAAEPVYDGRELKRWGISESALPPGSRVRFREPSFWRLYRKRILAVILFCLLQSAWIVALLVNRTTRRRAETQARDLSRRLIHAHEEERGRLARELHDDLSQRLARLAIDVGQIECSGEQKTSKQVMRSVREGLVSLSEDTHALSYRLHPSVLEDLGLVEALKAECERFSGQESIPIDMNLPERPTRVPMDTSLCLFRVVQEALRNVARHAGARAVEVSMYARDDGLHLAVCDNGRGFDTGAERRQPSLGLASMRERVDLLNGELHIESGPGQGTTVLAWVPLKRETP